MYNTKATILRIPGIVRMYDGSKRMLVVTVVAVVVVVEYVPGKPVSAIFCKICPKKNKTSDRVKTCTVPI